MWINLHIFLHSRTGIAAQSWLLSEVTYLITLIWTVALHFTILLRVAGTINIWIGLKVFILLAEAMIYEFHTFSMNLFLMFEFNCVAEEREAGAPHSSAARAQLNGNFLSGHFRTNILRKKCD